MSKSSISACDNAFHLKFWGCSNWPPAMLHAKFQVSSRPWTCFSKIQIWPKSAVNHVLDVYRPSKCFFSLLGFEFGVMWGCFFDVFGLPYRLASLLIWCICQNLCSVKRKFQWPISQLTKTIFTWNFEGDLIDHQPCFKPNFKFLAVQEPNFLEPKFGQSRLLTGFCMYIGPASVFVL